MWIFAFTPVVATSLPLLTPVILAAAGALGYRQLTKMSDIGGDINKELKLRLENEVDVEIKVDETVLEAIELEVGREETLFFQKESITLSVIKDERGKLRIKATAPKGTDTKLMQAEGKKLAEEIAQQFAANRAVESIERMNAEVAEEEILEDEEIRLKIRRWK